MNVLKWLYALLWRPTAGRPWTYESRAWMKRHPAWASCIAVIAVPAFVAAQVFLPMTFGWRAVPAVIFGDFAAFAMGHIVWGGWEIKEEEDFQ